MCCLMGQQRNIYKVFSPLSMWLSKLVNKTLELITKVVFLRCIIHLIHRWTEVKGVANLIVRHYLITRTRKQDGHKISSVNTRSVRTRVFEKKCVKIKLSWSNIYFPASWQQHLSPAKKFECYYVNDVIYFICSKNLTYFCNEIRNITICKRESSSEM